eukprot:gene2597-2899_t
MFPESYVNLIAGTQTLLQLEPSKDLFGFSRGTGLRDITNILDGRGAAKPESYDLLW